MEQPTEKQYLAENLPIFRAKYKNAPDGLLVNYLIAKYQGDNASAAMYLKKINTTTKIIKK